MRLQQYQTEIEQEKNFVCLEFSYTAVPYHRHHIKTLLRLNKLLLTLLSNTTLGNNLLYVPSYSFGKYEKAFTAVCEKKVAQRKAELLAATECANLGKNSSVCADNTNLSVAVRLKKHF